RAERDEHAERVLEHVVVERAERLHAEERAEAALLQQSELVHALGSLASQALSRERDSTRSRRSLVRQSSSICAATERSAMLGCALARYSRFSNNVSSASSRSNHCFSTSARSCRASPCSFSLRG